MIISLKLNSFITSIINKLDIPLQRTYFQESANKAADASLEDMELLWFITFIVGFCVLCIIFSIFLRSLKFEDNNYNRNIYRHYPIASNFLLLEVLWFLIPYFLTIGS